MKPKSYLSSQLEVRSALSGELSRLFVPVKPQPFIDERGHICRQTKKGIVNYGKTLEDKPALKNFAQCCAPYPPESLIYFREAWTEAWAFTVLRGSGRYLYKADGNPYNIAIESVLWNSPATMPREAARIYATLGEPTVELVDGIWKWAYPVTVVSINGKPE